MAGCGFVIDFLFLLVMNTLPSLLAVGSRGGSFSGKTVICSVVYVLLYLERLGGALEIGGEVTCKTILVFFCFLVRRVFIKA